MANGMVINLTAGQKRLLGEGVWAAGGKIGTAVGVMVGIRLLTEYVQPGVYGTVSLLLGVATLSSNMFTAPLMLAAQRFYPEAKEAGTIEQLRSTVKKMLGGVLIVLAVVVLGAGAIWSRQTGSSYMVFPLLLLLLILMAGRTLELSLLNAARRQKAYAVWQVAEAWAKPMLAVGAVVLLGSRPEAVLICYAAAVGGIILILHWKGVKLEGKSKARERAPLDKKVVKELMHYALPLLPLAIVGWVNSMGDRFIIGGMLGIKEVGIYAAGYGLMSMPFRNVQGVIGQTLRPVYFQAVASGKERQQVKLLRGWLASTAFICALGVVGVFLLKDVIVQLLLAEEYRGCSALLGWLAGGVAVQAVGQVFETILYGYKRTGYVLAAHSVGAGVCLAAVVVMVHYMGLKGAALACPVYFMTLTVVMMILVGKAKRSRGLYNDR